MKTRVEELKGRGPIRPQIGPSYFFRRIALETIQIDRFQQGEHFGAILDTFRCHIIGNFAPALCSIFYAFSIIRASMKTDLYMCPMSAESSGFVQYS